MSTQTQAGAAATNGNPATQRTTASATSNGSSPTTTAGKPAVTTTTLTLAQSVKNWWSTVQGEWSQFESDATEATYYTTHYIDHPEAEHYDSAAISDIQALQAAPPAPDPTINTPWQAGLADFLQTYRSYLAEVEGQPSEPGYFWTAVKEMNEANAVMKPLIGETIPGMTFNSSGSS